MLTTTYRTAEEKALIESIDECVETVMRACDDLIQTARAIERQGFGATSEVESRRARIRMAIDVIRPVTPSLARLLDAHADNAMGDA